MIEASVSGPGAAVRRVVIVGGGTSGWMCAAGLARLVPPDVQVTLVESEEIGVIGVGEATIPTLLEFNNFLGLDEDEFVRQTRATFKLGIEFVDWDRRGERYFHPFGFHGRPTAEFKFHQLWLRLRHLERQEPALAGSAGEIGDYNLCTAAARRGRFGRAQGGPGSVLASLRHAYHFDAALYGQVLRAYAEARGVRRREGLVVSVQQRPADGFIESVTLRDGRVIKGDLFIDCSGFRALLIEGALDVPFVDWGHYLPCDRALAVPSALSGPPEPYTRSTSGSAGWRWRIPLQHRMGNGHVYCSAFLDDEAANRELLAGLGGKALADPRPIRFRTGRRERAWEKNCVAIGLAGGFIEPLESTSIHLVQMGLQRLTLLWPDRGFNRAEIDQYNAATRLEYEQLRDFIVMHYKANRRDDSAFWRACRDMTIPDSLAHKIELFRANGRIFREQDDLFTEDSWLAVMLGQGITPRGYDRLVDRIPREDLIKNMGLLRDVVARAAVSLPTHRAFIAECCAASVGDLDAIAATP
ncbi:tryptophan halogenase family protein [Caulobacter sp. LARHSG274]